MRTPSSTLPAARPCRAEAERAIGEMVAARRVWLVHAADCGYEPRPHREVREAAAAAVVGYGRPEWARTGYAVGDWSEYQHEPLWRAWKARVGEAYQSVSGLITARVGAALTAYRIPSSDEIVDEIYSVARERLLHGLDLYDPAQGRAPSTYLCWWILSGIRRTIASHRKATTVALRDDHANALAGGDLEALLNMLDGGLGADDAQAYLEGRAVEGRTAPVTSPRRRCGSRPRSTPPCPAALRTLPRP